MKYYVKKNDTLSKIAKENNISLRELIQMNPQITNPSLIHIGLQININTTELLHIQSSKSDDHSKNKLDAEVTLYTVKRGDYLSKIAKNHNISLQELVLVNNLDIKNPILIGLKLLIPNSRHNKESVKTIGSFLDYIKGYDLRTWNLNNLLAIYNSKKDGNYAVIDKQAQLFTIYDKDNNVLFLSEPGSLATGASGDDYNTITSVDKNGKLKHYAGNNSTPAGISYISGYDKYHNLPSWTRSSEKGGDNTKNIASSLHYNKIRNKFLSNGCINMSPLLLKDLYNSNLMKKGLPIYTLPSNDDSYFWTSQGALNFSTREGISKSREVPTEYKQKWNNYIKEFDEQKTREDKEEFLNRITQTMNDAEANSFKDYLYKRYWNDYLTSVDRSYHELTFNSKQHLDDSSVQNTVAQAIIDNKKLLLKEFGMNSETYDKVASLAMGIAQQESKFGDSLKYKLKSIPGLLKFLKDFLGIHSADSLGIFLHKIALDNLELKDLYEKYGIGSAEKKLYLVPSPITTSGAYGPTINNQVNTKHYSKSEQENSIRNNESKATLAVLLKLLYMYKNETASGRYKDANGNNIDRIDLLLYLYSGQRQKLLNKTAVPSNNTYLKSIKRTMEDFDFKSIYRSGGKLKYYKKK